MSRRKSLIVFDADWDTVATCSHLTVKYRKGNKSKKLKECLQLIEESKIADAEYKKALHALKVERNKIKEPQDVPAVSLSEQKTINTGGNTMISSVDEAQRIMKNYEFNKKVNDLRNRIQHEIEWKQRDKTPELKQVNEFLISEMNKLLEMPIHSEKDYEYVSWLFNYGNLRTESEITSRKKAEYDANYVLSGQYETDCFLNKSAWGWGSFLITFFIFWGLLWKELWIFSIPIAVMIALIAALIGMAIASKQNIDRAIEHGVPKNHPRLQHDRNELKTCGIGAAAAAGSIYHHGKKACKELMDVDHWPKH